MEIFVLKIDRDLHAAKDGVLKKKKAIDTLDVSNLSAEYLVTDFKSCPVCCKIQHHINASAAYRINKCYVSFR